jgi:hypothetical protein
MSRGIDSNGIQGAAIAVPSRRTLPFRRAKVRGFPLDFSSVFQPT